MKNNDINVSFSTQIKKESKICGKYYYYSNKTENRFCEGGLRCKGITKNTNDDNPLVTIITVVFNSQNTIERCIKSVLKQSYLNIEYIVIDGGSTDNTLNIIREFDNKIDYYISEDDDGIYYAMNKGLSLANGDFIAFLNSDDEYYENAVEDSINLAKLYNAKITAGIANIVDKDGNYIKQYHNIPINEVALIAGIPTNHQTFFIHKDCFNECGDFNTNYKIAADTELILKMIQKKFASVKVDEVMVNFEDTGISSTNIEQMQQENALVLKQFNPSLSLDELHQLSILVLGYKDVFEKYCDYTTINNILNKNVLTSYQTIYVYQRYIEWTNKIPNYDYDLISAGFSTFLNRQNISIHVNKGNKVVNMFLTIENAIIDGGMRTKGIYKKSIERKPLVSIVTIVYNNAEVLERCIQSVLTQQYDNIEYIIVDGGSKDNTLSILNKYEEFIDYYVSESDNGIYNAINKGLSLVSGDIIGILNSDDEFFESAINHVVQAFQENSTVGLVYGKSIYIDTDNNSFPHYFREFNEFMFWDVVCNHESMFVTKEVYEKTGGYDEKYKIASDMKWTQQIFKNDIIPYALDYFVLKHYAGGVSTYAVNESIYERYELLKENFPFLNDSLIEKLFDKYFYFKDVDTNFPIDIIPTENSVIFNKMLELMRINKSLKDGLIKSNNLSIKNNSFKILQLSFYLVGGAGYAALRLQQGLNEKGLDSKLLSVDSNLPDNLPDNLYLINGSKDTLIPQHEKNRPSKYLTMFSWTFPNDFNFRDFLMQFDIINLHWIQGLLTTEDISYLSNTGKPVIWTFHDKNPITGGCHYTHGCEKWKTDCKNCPQLIDTYDDYPAKILDTKKKYINFKNITVVVLNSHFKELVQESPLFNDSRIEIIPNGIDTEKFSPNDKILSKKKLGLPLDKKILLFVSAYESSIKGYQEFSETVKLLDGNEYYLLIIGQLPPERNFKIKYKDLGYIDENTLIDAYNSADVTVLPSVEDNFPNIMLESISCGTPVVGFKVGGIPDLISDGYNGYTVEVGDCKALAESIKKIFKNSDLSENCREYAIQNLRLDLQADRYNKLYKSLSQKNINKKHANNDFPEIFSETAPTINRIMSERYQEVIYLKNNEIQNLKQIDKYKMGKAPKRVQITNFDLILRNSSHLISKENQKDIKKLRESSLFYYKYYLSQISDENLLTIDPLLHYYLYRYEKNPNPLFDSLWYLNKYIDVKEAGFNPLLHYYKYGADQGYDPHPDFSTNSYLVANPDVKETGMNPLAHYLQIGALEGRPLR